MEAQITHTGMYVGKTRKRRIVTEVRVERAANNQGSTMTLILEAKSQPLTLAKAKSWSYRTVDILRSQMKDLEQRVQVNA